MVSSGITPAGSIVHTARSPRPGKAIIPNGIQVNTLGGTFKPFTSLSPGKPFEMLLQIPLFIKKMIKPPLISCEIKIFLFHPSKQRGIIH